MDFKKIYKAFETARAKYRSEKMSDIIVQVNEHCEKMVQAGKGNEIPSEAYEIVSYVNVLIWQVMQFLSDGRGDKAKSYLMQVTQTEGFERFFYLYYLIGRTFYMTGDYLQAIKLFKHYEQIRSTVFDDNDEINLFYLANSLALMGNFQAAAQLYENILKIKADFPEVKNNLKIVQGGTNKKLIRELKSLWNFCDWQDVPIFINARDRLGVMKKLIDWLLDAGYRNLIILDNNSTYPPLLEYYSELDRDSRLKIILLIKNLGYKSLWQSGILEQMKISTPYVYTDPDILPIESCPRDFVKRLMKILDSNHEIRKVGLGLVFEDITFFDKEKTQQHESQFYTGTQIGKNLYYAQVDTTFALYSNVRHYNLRFSLRTTGNLQAYHLPWYFDYNNLPEDEKYYMAHADKNSVTTVKKFWEAIV